MCLIDGIRLLLSVAAVAQFGVSGASGQTPTVRDSLGIRITEQAQPLMGEFGAWATVDPEPTLEIGLVEGAEPYLFTSIAQAIEAADGRIAIVDGGVVTASYEVRVFDEAGGHLRTFGGKGEGPGEFRADPVIRLVNPDTILAWDPGASRLTWFTFDGAVARERTVRTAGASLPMILSSHPWTVLSDGSVMVMSLEPSPDRRERLRRRITERRQSLLILPAGASSVRTIGDLPGTVTLWAGSGMVGLSLDLHQTVAEGWAVLDGASPSVVIADDAHGGWALSVYGLDGAKRGLIRIDVSRQQVRGAVARGYRRRLLERIEGFPPGERPHFEAAVDRIPMPDSAPAIGRVIVDARNRLWVKRWSAPWVMEADTFDLIDSSGAWLGSVQVGRDLGRILSIGADHLLFVREGPLGTPQVRRHSLRPRRNGENGKSEPRMSP